MEDIMDTDNVQALDIATDSGGSDHHDRFVRLANKRVNAAIKALQLVGNLGNRVNYNYDDKEAAKIVRALQTELDQVKGKFAPSNGKDKKGGFSL
jgi:hypothetical protein